jgi:dTMP kinase
MDISFFERTRTRYLELADADDSVLVVDAGQSIDAVAASIRTKLSNWLSGQIEPCN